jgi:hypothetical protein
MQTDLAALIIIIIARNKLRTHIERTPSLIKMVPPSSLVTTLQGVPWLGPQLRASNEALPRARVARARGTNQATPLLLPDFFSILLISNLAFLEQLIQYRVFLFRIFVVLKRL